MIKLKRVYESTGKDDGKTFLVERLWPRGVKKTALADAIWLKDVAPSTGLRKWFGHDPKKWAEFQRRYQAEMKEHEVALEPILQAARHGTVTLQYSSHDTEHNNAVVLRGYLERKLGAIRSGKIVCRGQAKGPGWRRSSRPVPTWRGDVLNVQLSPKPA